MKKALVLFTILLLALVVCGCRGLAEPIDPASSSNSSQHQEITEEMAIEIASQYWGIKSGDRDEKTGYQFIIMPVESSSDNIKIALKWLVANANYSTLDMVEINPITGEIVNGETEK